MKWLLLILACMSLLIACEKFDPPDLGGGGKPFENLNDALIEWGNIESRLPNDIDDTSNNIEANEL
jgi:hypothetical protein